MFPSRASRADNDLYITAECEIIHQLLERHNAGLQLIAAMTPEEQSTAAGQASYRLQVELYRDYEERVFRLQQTSSAGVKGLLEKGAALADLLEYLEAPTDTGLLRAMAAFVTDVRRIAGRPHLVSDKSVR